MNESKIASKYMNYAEDERGHKWFPEVHYNDYGDKGVVDLVHVIEPTATNKGIEVIEIKSDYAIQEATGANEIIRQFNKHREYFWDGQQKFPKYKYDSRSTWLLFYNTETSIRHIDRNWGLYNSLDQQNKSSVRGVLLFDDKIGTFRVSNRRVWEDEYKVQEMKDGVLND